MKSFYKTVRNHIITGFIFMMPVLITIVVLGKFWKQLLVLGGKISRLFRVDTVFGTAGDAVIAIVLLLLLCVIAGFLVKLSVFKQMSDMLDAKLASLIPGYTDLRKETKKKIGDGPKEDVFETCLVHTLDHWQPAYLIDVSDTGEATVYIPVAPTFTTGQVAIVPKDSYRKLKIDSATLNNYLKKFGKGISSV